VSAATLFIDRDGTLIEEPADSQLDSLAKVRFMPGVFAALAALARRGYRLVMVTNQDGLGSDAQQFILDAFGSQGIAFEAVFVCPPQTGLVQQYLREREVDLAASAVIGDRDTDLEFAANLKVRGVTVRRHGAPHETWPAALQDLIACRQLLDAALKDLNTALGFNPNHVRAHMDRGQLFERRRDLAQARADYRSASVQGKVLAKKGLWVTEFRIESGLNCGGHAFATDGLLLGPILEEFRTKRAALAVELIEMCNNALAQKGYKTFSQAPAMKITAPPSRN